MKALLIVDVENDFMPGGALAISQGDQVISVINALVQIFPCVVATKDWHPPHHISFASTHNKKPGETVVVKGMKQELWPDHCIRDTWGAEFAPGLKTDAIKKVFYKGADQTIDSYSAFYDNAHLRSTGLGEYLQELGVDEIYIAGLATDYCVKYSVHDAVRLGLKINVVIDGCRGIDVKPGDVDKAIAEMKEAGANFVQSSQVLRQGEGEWFKTQGLSHIIF